MTVCAKRRTRPSDYAFLSVTEYRGPYKSLSRPGRKQTRKHVRDSLYFNNFETRAVINFVFVFLQGKTPKEIHAILTETLACFLPGRAKDISAPMYKVSISSCLQLLHSLFKYDILVLFGNYLFVIGSVLEMYLRMLMTENTL